MTGPTKRVPNNPKSYSSVSDWYRKELNTSTLIHAVMSNRPARSLSAEDIGGGSTDLDHRNGRTAC